MVRKGCFICFQHFIPEEMTSKDLRYDTFTDPVWKGKKKYPGTTRPSIICNCTSCAEGMFQLSLKQLCTTPAPLKSPENVPWEPRCSLSRITEDNLSQCVLRMWRHCQCGASAFPESFTFPTFLENTLHFIKYVVIHRESEAEGKGEGCRWDGLQQTFRTPSPSGGEQCPSCLGVRDQAVVRVHFPFPVTVWFWDLTGERAQMDIVYSLLVWVMDLKDISHLSEIFGEWGCQINTGIYTVARLPPTPRRNT